MVKSKYDKGLKSEGTDKLLREVEELGLLNSNIATNALLSDIAVSLALIADVLNLVERKDGNANNK